MSRSQSWSFLWPRPSSLPRSWPQKLARQEGGGKETSGCLLCLPPPDPPHTQPSDTHPHRSCHPHVRFHPRSLPPPARTHAHPAPSGASLAPALCSPVALFRGPVLQLTVKVQLRPLRPAHEPARTPQGGVEGAHPLPHPLPHPETDNHFLGQVGTFKRLVLFSPPKGKRGHK